MAIRPKSERNSNEKEVIDLQSEEGNAFYILARAESLAKRIGYSEHDINKLMDEMKAGDYEHLIQVFDKHFGELVDLQR